VTEPIRLPKASARMRHAGGRFPGKVGRPPKGKIEGPLPRVGSGPSGATQNGKVGPQIATPGMASVPGVCPRRVLNVQGTATYLGVLTWQVRGMVHDGILVPVPCPGSGKAVRRHLFDVRDLDALIDRAKGRPLADGAGGMAGWAHERGG
jgi:hypothetical protein